MLQGPAPVLAPALPYDLDRLGEALVARSVDGLEIVQRAEDVVVPPWGECEDSEYRLDDFAGAVRAEEPVHQQEFPAAALRGPHVPDFASTVQFVEAQT